MLGAEYLIEVLGVLVGLLEVMFKLPHQTHILSLYCRTYTPQNIQPRLIGFTKNVSKVLGYSAIGLITVQTNWWVG